MVRVRFGAGIRIRDRISTTKLQFAGCVMQVIDSMLTQLFVNTVHSHMY